MRIEQLKGLGPKKAEVLNKKGIFTAEDLIRCLPVDYEDRRTVTPILRLKEGQPALARGTVISIASNGYRFGKKNMLRVTVSDGEGELDWIFFNGGYLSRAFKKGQDYFAYGTMNTRNGRRQMIHPGFFKAEEAEGKTGIVPVYPVMKGISQNDMRSFIGQLLESGMTEGEKEFLPLSITRRYDLAGPAEALRLLHDPQDMSEVEKGRRRLLYEEMMLLAIGLKLVAEKQEAGISMPKDGSEEEYISSLPYELTAAQKRAVKEIVRDMESEKPMNRLVQGDVGSGKTAVAETALYKAVRGGYQGAYMMPTEILVKQQAEDLSRHFEPFGIKVETLTGSMSKKEKDAVLADMISGEAKIVLGTHALIQPGVSFKDLGLVITDEQHRFGVRQRNALKVKGQSPDCLVMSATPIPRTLAMILFGDMDISVIDELPPGRSPVKTKAVTGKSRDKVYAFVEEQIEAGRQAYVVAPLIEESEALENVRSAAEVFADLSKRFKNRKLDLLHGEMTADEKAEIMERFAAGKTDILVSTVVIEVGINVPNASVMVIENSERFGLSQLHQLRGRVGRGEHQSFCVLITENTGETSLERAKTMTESNDGFYIAEKDLELRGPGEFFGSRQHGVPASHIFDLINNMEIYEQACGEADRLMACFPDLEAGGGGEEYADMTDEKLARLKEQVLRVFGDLSGPTL